MEKQASNRCQRKLLWLVIFTAASAACLPSAAARRAETYRTGLEARAGQETKDVVPVVTTDRSLMMAYQEPQGVKETHATQSRRE